MFMRIHSVPGSIITRQNQADNISRPDLQLPSQADLGVHIRATRSKRFSTMAYLRLAYAPSTMALARDTTYGGRASRCFLDAAGDHVCVELCTGGLGHSRTGAVTEASEGSCLASGILICDMDLPNAYIFELRGDTGCGMGFGAYTADC